jgi:hypothetical protein
MAYTLEWDELYQSLGTVLAEHGRIVMFVSMP